MKNHDPYRPKLDAFFAPVLAVAVYSLVPAECGAHDIAVRPVLRNTGLITIGNQGSRCPRGGGDGLEDDLIAVERATWQAWAYGNGEAYAEHMTEDAIVVASAGVTTGRDSIVQTLLPMTAR